MNMSRHVGPESGGPRKYVPPHLRGGGESDGKKMDQTVPDYPAPYSNNNNTTNNNTQYHQDNRQHRKAPAEYRNTNAIPHAPNPIQQNKPQHTNLRPSITGTAWDVRDGRRYIPEKDYDVFNSEKMQSTGIKFDSYDKVPVEVKGFGSEQIVPLETFQSVGGQFSPLLMQNVARVNYNKPTPIQKNSIPTILAGRDLMACAQTGSGKTAAFLYPILAQMLKQGPPPTMANTSSGYAKRSAYPVCLVLSPTRELAMQIYEEARKFQFGTGVRTVAVYGGSDIKRQIMDLDMGCDICVATPGRLVDLLERKKVKLTLVQFLVLDEADRMLDMGFFPQIKMIVLGFDMPPSSPYPPPPGPRTGRQTVMFSATFPREIQMLAKEFLSDYIYLAVGRVGSTNEFIRQRLQYADEDQKIKLLLKLLRESEKGLTIIFVETKRKADMIEDYLLEEEFPAVSIHGDRTQQEREAALRLFKAGKRPILVATDVAARGLDISNVTHVINYDLPTNIDDYVHRIGRTGRAGNLGVATSFVNESNKPILKDLLNLLQEANQDIPSFLPPLVMSCVNTRHTRYDNNNNNRSGNNNNRNYNNRSGNTYQNPSNTYNNNTHNRSTALSGNTDWRENTTSTRGGNTNSNYNNTNNANTNNNKPLVSQTGFSARECVSTDRHSGSVRDAW